MSFAVVVRSGGEFMFDAEDEADIESTDLAERDVISEDDTIGPLHVSRIALLL